MIFFLNFAQNIDCGYTLEPPWPQLYYIEVGFKGVLIARTCFPDEDRESATP